jgi:hypothetical protein
MIHGTNYTQSCTFELLLYIEFYVRVFYWPQLILRILSSIQWPPSGRRSYYYGDMVFRGCIQNVLNQNQNHVRQEMFFS